MKKVVILAAGKGKRMGAGVPKVLVKIKGKPMIEYLVRSVIKSGVDHHPVIVVSPDNKDMIKQALKKYGCRYAAQNRQLGTGHAMACAKKVLGKKVDYVICFYGDHPFIKAATIRKLADSCNGVITMMTTAVRDFLSWRKNFYHWGRIVRSHGHVKEIIEFKDADNKTKETREVNPAIYCFSSKWLWQNIKKLKNLNAQNEYYLTDLIKMAFKQNLPVESFPIDPEEAMGINTKEELSVAKKLV